MNRKMILKRILDAVMIVLLLVLMSFQYTGAEIHEWMGTGMFLSVLIFSCRQNSTSGEKHRMSGSIIYKIFV